uniref:Uncharacterized protein n=1 Tax=Cannabis sativa TaxID=3483 RepID=A0A803QWI2_CANSA
MNNFTKSVVLLVLFIVQLIIIPGLKPPPLETTEPMVPAGPTAYRFINMSAAIGVGSYRRRLARSSCACSASAAPAPLASPCRAALVSTVSSPTSPLASVLSYQNPVTAQIVLLKIRLYILKPLL